LVLGKVVASAEAAPLDRLDLPGTTAPEWQRLQSYCYARLMHAHGRDPPLPLAEILRDAIEAGDGDLVHLARLFAAESGIEVDLRVGSLVVQVDAT